MEDLLLATSEEDLARRVLEKFALGSEADRLRAARRLKSRGFDPAIALRGMGDVGDDPDR